MSISLTAEQAQARLREPQRRNILSIAINEDIKSVFPLHLTGNKTEDSTTIGLAMHNVVTRVLLRALEIIYNENLDS